MYRPDITRKKSGTPVLSRKEIDIIGENIVRDFMPEALKMPQEIDIDLLAQDYLGMDQDFQYLSHCGVYLGMTVFNDTEKVPVYDPMNERAEYISAKAHTVIIDKTLLAENQEHRYRFTMGHEASHEFLHKEYFNYDVNQMTLFDMFPEAMIQCRVDAKKYNARQSAEWTDMDWMEWQANALSSAILMPKSAVLEVAQEVSNSRRTAGRLLAYTKAMKVAKVFNVSNEAAMYRLKELDVVHSDILFNSQIFDILPIMQES